MTVARLVCGINRLAQIKHLQSLVFAHGFGHKKRAPIHPQCGANRRSMYITIFNFICYNCMVFKTSAFFWLAGFLARFWGWLAGRAFSLARTARFLLKISWRFCLITTVRFWRGCQKIKFWSRILSHTVKVAFSIAFYYKKKPKSPWKQKAFGVVHWRP